jgi:hypothetical protein
LTYAQKGKTVNSTAKNNITNSKIIKGEIDEDNISFYIEYLASDSLRGRYAGTHDDRVASKYILAQFQNLDLKLPFDKGLQKFDIVKDLFFEPNNSFTFDNYEAKIFEDFITAANSSNASISAYVVFAGYGIDKKFSNEIWNDYQSIDVKNKLVLILSDSPKKSKKEYDLNISENEKIKIAKNKGCAGIIIVSGVETSAEDVLPTIYIRPDIVQNTIPIIYISRKTANKLLSNSNQKIEDLEKKINKKDCSFSFDINKKIKIETNISYSKKQSNNIVGILEGNDEILKHEFVVVGAHYDHLGIGGILSGSRMPDTIAVHNGADDNASGVAGIIELARVLSELKDTLKRSIIFVSFGAEELGLIGSKFFVDDDFMETHKVISMINFDMIGRLNYEEANFRVEGVGTALEFPDLVFDCKQDDNLSVTFKPQGIASTDHARFYMKKIPVLFFTTGLHEEYHTPMDDADKINFSGEKQILDFAKSIIINLSRTDRITYVKAKM